MGAILYMINCLVFLALYCAGVAFPAWALFPGLVYTFIMLARNPNAASITVGSLYMLAMAFVAGLL